MVTEPPHWGEYSIIVSNEKTKTNIYAVVCNTLQLSGSFLDNLKFYWQLATVLRICHCLNGPLFLPISLGIAVIYLN